MTKDLLTTHQAARALGISPRRVRALIASGRLPATKHGAMWVIRVDDLELVKERPTGRPPKGARVQVDASLDPSKTTVYFIRRPGCSSPPSDQDGT